MVEVSSVGNFTGTIKPGEATSLWARLAKPGLPFYLNGSASRHRGVGPAIIEHGQQPDRHEYNAERVVPLHGQEGVGAGGVPP